MKETLSNEEVIDEYKVGWLKTKDVKAKTKDVIDELKDIVDMIGNDYYDYKDMIKIIDRTFKKHFGQKLMEDKNVSK